MIKYESTLIQIKKIKNLTMYYDIDHHEIIFEKDKVFFTLKKNEIFPALRGLISGIQRFYRRKIKNFMEK